MTIEELVEKELKIVQKYLLEFKEGKNFEQIARMLEKTKMNCKIIMSGPPGSGKTYFARGIANDLGLTVVEPNPEDSLERVHRMVRTKISSTLFLFDNADKIKDTTNLEKILTDSMYPIFLLVDEEWKVKPSIRNRCTSYKVRAPSLATIVDFVKEEAEKNGMKPDFTRITAQDFRTAYNQAFYKSESFESKNKFEQVKDLLTKGELNSDLNLIWLLGNLNRFYHGRKAYEQMELIAEADKIKDIDVMKYGHKSKKLYATAQTPYYVKRSKIFRRGNNWGGRG